MRWWQLLLFAQFAHAPSSGPGTGSTSVVLHSTEAVAACQFGTFNVTASYSTLPQKWAAGWFGKVLGDAGGAARRGAREGRYRS